MTSTDSTTRFARILADLATPRAERPDGTYNDHNVYQLATLADCMSPDGPDSAGARFLATIARDVADLLDAIADGSTDDQRARLDDLTSDGAHEIADGAVPIYTHERWLTFVDLGAYQEDPAGELGDDGSDLTQTAGAALYLIATRLVAALAEELTTALDDDAADRDEECTHEGERIGEPCDYCGAIV